MLDIVAGTDIVAFVAHFGFAGRGRRDIRAPAGLPLDNGKGVVLVSTEVGA